MLKVCQPFSLCLNNTDMAKIAAENLLSLSNLPLMDQAWSLKLTPPPSPPAKRKCHSKNSQPTLLWEVRNREGYSPLRLYHPYDVTFINDKYACVVEGFFPYSRIQVVNLENGRLVRNIGQGQIMPYGVAADDQGNIAITDHKDRTVKFYSLTGELKSSWKTDLFDWPDGIAITKSGKYIVSDWYKGCITEHDLDGTCINQFNTINTREAEVSCPAYVTIDIHGRIITTDTFDKSVKIFSPEGKLLEHFRNKGTDEALIKDPRGVTTDAAGNIIITDWASNAIVKYNSKGCFQRTLLDESDGVDHPWGVAMDKQGQLLVSQHKLNQQPSLKLFQTFSS